MIEAHVETLAGESLSTRERERAPTARMPDWATPAIVVTLPSALVVREIATMRRGAWRLQRKRSSCMRRACCSSTTAARISSRSKRCSSL